ncbi:hypothetical protein BF29_2036 [Heyndrickxia coagulans DSM 1 = ATCC 7050]|uniref:Uncharacterized protein n=1 Tax=Heyndrickxia coagulans DSM 1 = ATCC 7050 TaxID=1121088 RepID=A0A8B4BVD7_HEYCO|nr:hypothetical protein BF29_2036 [Heyndrickxia coagulans DSM 1 = ATCC 7050]SHF43866.1 hypothetical protein SAMN02745208_02015 [Heyndrickxia coagulans DSM 1 = ATCC 7050]
MRREETHWTAFQHKLFQQLHEKSRPVRLKPACFVHNGNSRRKMAKKNPAHGEYVQRFLYKLKIGVSKQLILFCRRNFRFVVDPFNVGPKCSQF